MSILLAQNRENEAQQPGTFFSASSICGKQTNQASFWDGPGTAAASGGQGQVFVFGSGRTCNSSNGMEQVQTMLRTMKLGSDTEDGKFTFGQNGTQAAPSQSSMNPRPRFSKLRKSAHPTKGKTVASSDGSMSAPVFDNVPLSSGLSTQSFTFNSRASTESTYLHPGEPSTQALDTQSSGLSGTGRSDFNKQDQNDPSAGYASCTNKTNVEPGSNAELNSGSNFRQWGSKADEDPFQFRASTSRVGTGSQRSWGVGGDTAAASDFHGSATGLDKAEAFNFEALRNCPPVSTADPFGGTEQPLEEDGNAVAAEFSTLRLDIKAKTTQEIGKTAFIFTGKQSAATEAEKPLEEDGNSVATDFSTLRLGTEAKTTQESGRTPFVFTVKQSAAPEATPAPFVFTSGVQSTSTEGPAMETSHSSVPDTAPPFGFVFRAAGDDSSPAIAKKKKDQVKKMAARLKRSRRASPAIAEGQGSPMDVSPCPDTGARLSPSETTNNSESEDERRPEGLNARSQSSDALVEELRAAAAELRLGDQKEEPANSSDEKSRFQSPGEFGMFTFSASPPAAASKIRQRRLKRLSSRTKSTSGPTIDLKQPEVEFHKIRTEEPLKSAQPFNSSAAEHACEKWRLRGNQAYANGDFPKAEEYYSRGASSVPPNETSQSCIRATMLCYSNRAATRMAVGRMRDALADCMRAMAVDPNFLRVRLRAGSCHLALGELEAASSYFRDCLYRGNDQGKYDMKLASEAAEGLRKCQQVDEYFERVRDALSSNTSGDCMTALRLLNEALTSAPHSEVLLELKARCLLHLRKYEDVVRFCDETLSLAEQNWPVHGEPPPTILPKAWRSWMTAKALFHMGRLEDALDQLTKLTEYMILSCSNKISQAMDADMDTLSQCSILVHDLLRYKAAGNEAFQAGKHADAVEHYTAALACNGESRPFNAVLFCNRAAASQALGQTADAIADCSRAIVLDAKYAKAISRRATLHNMVRDYSQACSDLRRLISLYEENSKSARKTNSELRQARDRLTTAEEDLKRNHPIDHYLILSLKPSCTAVEVKKAYRKLALRHHPDKAGNLLVRSEGVDDGKELSEEIRNKAERLFKLIGEAYAVLSDPAKRSRYDAEEDLRKLRTRSSSSSNGASSEGYHHHYGRSTGRRRERWDRWDGYAYQRWQSAPDAAQPDTYARYARHSDVHWDDL